MENIRLLHFEQKLEDRINQSELRQLKSYSTCIDFSSNDYLSLKSEPLWEAYLKQEIPEEYWFKNLSSSRLISGNHPIKEKSETFFAEFYKANSALFFASGYNANLSIFSTIASKHDTILYDSDSHASIRDGLLLSHAKTIKFKHNNLEDLERKMIKSNGQIYVSVESVYSMDGSIAPLTAILELCKTYNALLIVDEAHGTGIFEQYGRGLCVELGIEQDVFIRVMTFGKAIGCHGAVVLGTERFKQFLINFARPFIYTTAPSCFDFLKAQKSVECIHLHPEWIIQLKENIIHFSNLLQDITQSHQTHYTPIIPFVNSNISALKSFEHLGIQNNLQFKSILSPTVSRGQERIRFSIQRSHTKEDFAKIGELLKSHFELL